MMVSVVCVSFYLQRGLLPLAGVWEELSGDLSSVHTIRP